MRRRVSRKPVPQRDTFTQSEGPKRNVIFHTRLHGWPPVLAVVQTSVEHWFFRTPLH